MFYDLQEPNTLSLMSLCCTRLWLYSHLKVCTLWPLRSTLFTTSPFSGWLQLICTPHLGQTWAWLLHVTTGYARLSLTTGQEVSQGARVPHFLYSPRWFTYLGCGAKICHECGSVHLSTHTSFSLDTCSTRMGLLDHVTFFCFLCAGIKPRVL